MMSLSPSRSCGSQLTEASGSTQRVLEMLTRSLLDNLRLMHNMGETVFAIDNIP
jgi:hypothetical protein